MSAGSASAAIGTGQTVNLNSGLCLDATNDATYSAANNGDPVQLWSCSTTGAAQQNWTFDATIGNWGTIKNGYGLCLDARDDATKNPSQNGDPVQVWSCNGGSQQLWKTGVPQIR